MSPPIDMAKGLCVMGLRAIAIVISLLTVRALQADPLVLTPPELGQSDPIAAPLAAKLSSDPAFKVGDTEHSHALVRFSRIPTREGVQIHARLIAPDTGATLASLAATTDSKNAEVIVQNALERFRTASPSVASSDIKLSVVNVRAVRGESRSGRPLKKLLAAFLSEMPGIVVLEREQPSKGTAGNLWTANFIVQGTIQPDFNDPKILILKIALIPPDGAEARSIEVKGDSNKLATLAKEAATAIAQELGKASGLPSWNSDKEATLFLEAADLAYREHSDEEASSAASAARALGLVNARLAELRLCLALERLIQYEYDPGDKRQAHRTNFPGEELESLVRLTARYANNARYHRGMYDFWFPESLGRIDEMIDAYREYLRFCQTDAEQRTIHEQGSFASEVLKWGSVPHLLIYREPDAKAHYERLARMAEELRNLYQEIQNSELSRKDKLEAQAVRAAMIPFWAAEGGNIEDTLRKTLSDSATEEKFGDRAWVQGGLVTGAYLACFYAIFSDLREVYLQLVDELLKSPHPADRAFAKYIEYSATDIEWKDKERKRQFLVDLYAEMEQLPEMAAKEPEALARYSKDLSDLFMWEGWTEKNFRVPAPAQGGKEQTKSLVDSLAQKVSWKYALYRIDHWPEGVKRLTDLTNPSLVNRNNELVERRSRPEEFELYFKPLLQMYQTELARESPHPEKLKYLGTVHSQLRTNSPDFVTEVIGPAAGSDGKEIPRLLARRKWSLQDQVSVFDSGPRPQLVCVDYATDGFCMLVRNGTVDFALLKIAYSDFSTVVEAVPASMFEDLPGDRFPTYKIVQNEKWLYLYSLTAPLLKWNKQSGEWKKLPTVSASAGIEMGGDFFFANPKEFYRIRAASDELEVLAGVERKKAESPIDNQPGSALHISEGDAGILVTIKKDQAPPKGYLFDPSASTWTEKSGDELKRRPIPPSSRSAVLTPDGTLLFSHKPLSREDLWKPGKADSIKMMFEGELPSNVGATRTRVQQTEKGLLFIRSGAPFDSTSPVWFISYDEIDAFLKGPPAESAPPKTH